MCKKRPNYHQPLAYEIYTIFKIIIKKGEAFQGGACQHETYRQRLKPAQTLNQGKPCRCLCVP